MIGPGAARDLARFPRLRFAPRFPGLLRNVPRPGRRVLSRGIDLARRREPLVAVALAVALGSDLDLLGDRLIVVAVRISDFRGGAAAQIQARRVRPDEPEEES